MARSLPLLSPFAITGIGSLPHKDPISACELIFSATDIPFWPQLPNISFYESMLVQYTEGLPYVKIDEKNMTVQILQTDSEELDRFYESMSDSTTIAISDGFAKGLYTFLAMLNGKRLPMLKGHITGPLTFTLGLKDKNGRYIYFDEELREISLMLLQAKARWQVTLLKRYADNVIIFIDEPILSAIGSSSYLGVSNEEVFRLLSSAVSAIHSVDGISGIHCCGRADWNLLLSTGVKIANFDAWDYFDAFWLYRDTIKEFINTGGVLAWGIIPTAGNVTENQLIEKMQSYLTLLADNLDSDVIKEQSILTPACGTGSRSIYEAIKVFQLAIRLKEAMRP